MKNPLKKANISSPDNCEGIKRVIEEVLGQTVEEIYDIQPLPKPKTYWIYFSTVEEQYGYYIGEYCDGDRTMSFSFINNTSLFDYEEINDENINKFTGEK
jgi:hypothetical protein